jgi:hypothetical protein
MMDSRMGMYSLRLNLFGLVSAIVVYFMLQQPLVVRGNRVVIGDGSGVCCVVCRWCWVWVWSYLAPS